MMAFSCGGSSCFDGLKSEVSLVSEALYLPEEVTRSTRSPSLAMIAMLSALTRDRPPVRDSAEPPTGPADTEEVHRNQTRTVVLEL
jgi:hypothetical protein